MLRLMKRLEAWVRGRVQGVGYRAFVERVALELGLAGYAKNLPDGRVEVVAEGEEEALNLLLEKLKAGPRLARVEGVEARFTEAQGLRGFRTL